MHHLQIFSLEFSCVFFWKKIVILEWARKSIERTWIEIDSIVEDEFIRVLCTVRDACSEHELLRGGYSPSTLIPFHWKTRRPFIQSTETQYRARKGKTLWVFMWRYCESRASCIEQPFNEIVKMCYGSVNQTNRSNNHLCQHSRRNSINTIATTPWALDDIHAGNIHNTLQINQ